MQKTVFDADGLIKLFKSGLLEKLCTVFKCVITQEVYDEAIQQGLKGFYPEAESLKKLVEVKKLLVERVRFKIKKESVLGRGESSVLALCRQEKNFVAVSDDQRFLMELDKEGTNFFTPASLVVVLHENKVIQKHEARKALELMRPLIRKSVFEKAVEEIGGE